MSKLQHTPGKWIPEIIMNENGVNQLFVVKDNPGKSPAVAKIYGLTLEQRDANGLLIAAAPEMLAELIKIYNTIYNTQPECYWMPIKNIIESATGKSIEEVLK